MSAGLARAKKMLVTAQARLADAIAAEFPVGTSLSWAYSSSGRQFGHVIEHAREKFDQLKVKNRDTGAEYWIKLSVVQI